jgi:immunoglobulin-binding protein 1
LDEIESIVQECQILEHMAAMQLKFTSPNAPPPVPPPSKGLQVTHIGKDFTSRREVIKSKVFGMSWSQPTMTLQEVAEIEMQQAIDKERREKAYRAENPEVLSGKELVAQGLEDDEDKADLAAKKDRDWDDWKDDNPKGAGVTKRF